MSTQTAESVPEPVNYDVVIGRRVHQLMWDQQLTQVAFGERIGVDQSSLAKRLRGKRGWSTTEVARAAQVLGVSVAYLYAEELPVSPVPDLRQRD